MPPKGDTGATGATGPEGPTGPDGPTGIDGKDGSTGPQGSTGPSGPTGTDGKDGNDGTDGKDGATGPQGSTGPKGSTGPQGKHGQKGVKGDNGHNGQNGQNGHDGNDGAAGAKGDTGAKGNRGKQGETGATGDRGHKGNPGDTGAAGAKGDTGAKGNRGKPGDTGATGDHGDTGSEGEDGRDGREGDFGRDGRDGDDGRDGRKGDDGNHGDDGNDGRDGRDGKDGSANILGIGDVAHPDKCIWVESNLCRNDYDHTFRHSSEKEYTCAKRWSNYCDMTYSNLTQSSKSKSYDLSSHYQTIICNKTDHKLQGLGTFLGELNLLVSGEDKAEGNVMPTTLKNKDLIESLSDQASLLSFLVVGCKYKPRKNKDWGYFTGRECSCLVESLCSSASTHEEGFTRNGDDTWVCKSDTWGECVRSNGQTGLTKKQNYTNVYTKRIVNVLVCSVEWVHDETLGRMVKKKTYSPMVVEKEFGVVSSADGDEINTGGSGYRALSDILIDCEECNEPQPNPEPEPIECNYWDCGKYGRRDRGEYGRRAC